MFKLYNLLRGEKMKNILMFKDVKNINFYKVLKFIIPTYLTALFTTLYTIVDGIYVSQYVGTNALAAINIVYPIVNLLTGIAMMFAVGGSSLSSIYLGKNDKTKANQMFQFCIVSSLIIGIIISWVILLYLSDILVFLGATSITLDYCEIYIKIWLFGTIAIMLKEIFVYFIRIDGNPKISFIVSASGGILNIILDYIFVGKMSLGIFGAGIATILGLILSMILGIIYFIKYSNNIKFKIEKIKLNFLPPCIVNGSSEFINQLAIAITTVVFNKTALTYAGDDGVAAVSIIMYVQFIFLGIYTGYSMGISPLLGYNYGNKNKDVLIKLEKYSYRFFSIIPSVLYIISFIFAPLAVSFFATKGTNVYNLGVMGMRIYSIGYFFSGLSIFTAVRLTSYAKGQYSAVITSLRSFILLILFLKILPLFFDLNGMWMAVPFAEITTFIITLILIFKTKKIPRQI